MLRERLVRCRRVAVDLPFVTALSVESSVAFGQALVTAFAAHAGTAKQTLA